MAFDDIRLPEDIESGAKGGPAFKSDVMELSSGAEQRNEGWEASRQKWDIGYGVLDQTGYSAVRDFFYGRRAKVRGFRFKDFSDFSATAEPQGTGDGTRRTFLLIKTYESAGPNPYVRRITRPVTGTLNVYLNGVLTVDYVEGAGGWIRFNTAPGAGVVVTADFEFDVPVRFDVDEFPLVLAWILAGEVGSLPIIELRDEFNAAPTAVTFLNTTTTLPEHTDTTSHIKMADIAISDDPFGTNALTLTGADAAFFELVGTLDALDRTGVALYLKAGTVLDFAKKPSYSVTVNVDDAVAGGSHPQASATHTLAVTDVNDAPSVRLTNLVLVEPNGTSTASPIRVADIEVVDDALGLRALTLSGADAAQFTLTGSLTDSGTFDAATGRHIYNGVSLYTVAGLDYSTQKTFACHVDVADSGLPGPPQGTAPFSMTFGVVPGSLTDTVPGSKSTVFPSYTTLTITMEGAGAGGGGFNVLGADGGATTLSSLGLTAGGGKAAVTGSLLGGIGGTATGGDTNTPGAAGANGLDYSKNLATTYPNPFSPVGFTFGTAAGGNNADGVNGGPATQGGFYTFPLANTDSAGNINVNGAAATGTAGGGAGATQYGCSSKSIVGGFTIDVTYAKTAPGGGGGSKLTKVYIYGITAGYPQPGDPLNYVVGAKGAGGASFANGGDGGDGKFEMSWT